MHWRKRDLWKVGIVVGGVLFLVLMTLVTVSAADAQGGVSGSAALASVPVPATPTEDATVTALNKEKLAQEVRQLQQSNDRNFSDWLWNFGSTPLTTLAALAAGLFALVRWFDDRRKEREKQSEDSQREQQKQEKERFESLGSVITALQEEKVGERIRAAIMLRMVFLRPGNEQFYAQIFTLAADNLRIRHTDPNTTESNDQFRRYLITLFQEAFPLARSLNRGRPQFLNSTGVQLDNSYLGEADLKQAWMPQASFQKADLSRANLTQANLSRSDLSGANLNLTNLNMANLSFVKLSNADLRGANLSNAELRAVDLSEADLRGANLSGAALNGANLVRADLSKANLTRANLSRATLHWVTLSDTDLSEADLSGVRIEEPQGDPGERKKSFGRTNLQAALSLKGTNLRGVKGLTREQLEDCKATGAIIDEDAIADSSQPVATSQSTNTQATPATSTQVATPPPPAQTTNAQAPAVVAAQVNTSTPSPQSNDKQVPVVPPAPPSQSS